MKTGTRELIRKGKVSGVEKWMERARVDDGEEGTLACPTLVSRELVDPAQWCCAWGMGQGGSESRAHGAQGLPLRLPPPGAMDGQDGQGQEELEEKVL